MCAELTWVTGCIAARDGRKIEAVHGAAAGGEHGRWHVAQQVVALEIIEEIDRHTGMGV